MSEVVHLKELTQLDRDIYEIEWFIKHSNDDGRKAALVQDYLAKDKRRKELESLLIQSEDKSQSAKAYKHIEWQLNAYIEELGKARQGLRLLRNQGLVLENHLFSIILNDIYTYVEREPLSIHIPAYLYYTYRNDESVSTEDVIRFFKEEKIILSELGRIDYTVLRNYCDGFKQRIIAAFIKSSAN